jgi:YesN/AraC family two-component response regulator
MDNKKTAAETILVVDDSENIRNIFRVAFEEYKIITAENGSQALAILRKPNDIALIVLDVMMPGENGLEVLKEIKKTKPDLKVVIMTAYSTKDVVVEALRNDADEYIEKPFDIANVKTIFERFLNNNSGANDGCFRAQNDKIRLTQRLLKNNYNKDFSLQDASRAAFLSYKYLSRAFKEKTGQGFNKCRMNLKLNSAKELLMKSRDTVNQVAYKSGYQNPSSFMKMFKKMTGKTPSEFRINQQTGGKK